MKDGELIDGFSMGNSPGQVCRTDLSGLPVVQRTMNGTTAVHAALHAPLVLCASLVNASATARLLRSQRPSVVTYVVTGDGGRAAEDLACADHIHALVHGEIPPGDTAERVRSSAAAHDLRRGLAAGYRGVSAEDIDLACDIDTVDFALVARRVDGAVQVHRHE